MCEMWGGNGRTVARRRDNRVKEDERDEVSISEQSIHHKRSLFWWALVPLRLAPFVSISYILQEPPI